MTRDINDFIASARDEVAAYDEQLDGFRGEASQTAVRREELRGRLDTAYRELASSLAPSLDSSAAQALADRLGSTELKQAFDAVESRVLLIETRLRAIESTPDFAGRTQLTQQLQAEIAEVEPDRAKLDAEIHRLEAHEGLRDLASRRFGTPSYPNRGWRKYVRREGLRDWKCADQIASAEGVSDVLEVLLRYEELKRRLAPIDSEVTDDRAHLGSIAKLQEEYDALTAELAAAPERVRRDVGEKAANAMLGAAANTDPTAMSALQGGAQLVSIDGMRHQIGYLTQLESQLAAEQADLGERAAKLRSESSKYSSDRYRYRNKRFSDETFGKRFGRAQRWDGRLNRYRTAGTTVYEFNSYGRGSYLGDVLWWDVMTDGRLNGSFIPEVEEYRRHNPDYSYHRSSTHDSRGSGTIGDPGRPDSDADARDSS